MEKFFDYQQAEPRLRELWEKKEIYATVKSAETFTVDTPPPTVSGRLHIGHLCSYTQTDVIVRYHRLSGRPIFYPMGFDDNGLPTERFVELKRNITPQQVGRKEFINICMQEIAGAEAEFEALWRRMGLSVDWSMKYSTLTPLVRRISQTSFLHLLKKGLVYRREDPAIYCTAYRTTVSQADLEDVEKETLFTEILFTTNDGERLVIATTRPELLPSCVALLYNPSDTRYKHLADREAIVPLFGHRVPILADEKVQVDKGTGLVMCCTFGDKMDIDWFRRYKFPYRPSIGLDGRWLPNTGVLAGLKVAEARARVLELLSEQNFIVKQEKIRHTVSIYERSKKEVEYLMLPQWFVKILPYKAELLALADTIDWSPAFMKTRFIDWVQNLQWDWCISRQRYSGIPFPIWYDKETGQIYTPDEKKLPLDPRDDAFPGTVPAGVELIPETDVMDTWNTSSLSPYICEALYKGTDAGMFDATELTFLPMGMRPQAHDIIRTWTFDTMVKTWLHHRVAPWKSIVISGHVLAAAGGKISKSKGGASLEPEQLLEQYPADVLRYWASSGTLGQDIAFSENTLKIGNKLVTKLWNACRFAREHLQGEEWKSPSIHLRGSLNEWILHRATAMFSRYRDCFTRNEYSLALEAVEQFFWNDFCDNYLEFIKFHFFEPDTFEAAEVAATRWTLANLMLRLLQLFAPFMPYVTEELYQLIFAEVVGAPSIHVTRFDAVQTPFATTSASSKIPFFLALVDQIRRMKSEKGLSLKTDLADCVIVAPIPVTDFLKGLEETIKGITCAKAIAYAETSTAGSYLQENNGIWRATIVLE
ncbi:MAG: valine--tRNA ligase [Candidatus Dependentiae bacterium]|nr:valine--tRNA ligase [Candidatus Dependentiae bacterium]